ncbi:DUF3413 domain-containing protein [Vibrio sp. WXL210]|uniref:DUF3413 domain-containing protein n=1 Tax=Vibrio sp. WXL210 TaxID=3450709 RepID=UPI003EC4BE94
MVDSGNSYSERVSRLVGWGHWFAFFNIIAAMLIGTRYIAQSPWPESLLGQLYLAISWVGHFGFLVFALYLLVLFPLTFLVPSKKLFRLLTVLFSTISLTVLLIDTQTYQSISLHLNPVVWELLFTDNSSPVSRDFQHLFIVLPMIFLLELGLSEWVWRKQRKLSHRHIGRPIAAVFFICFSLSHVIYVWADISFYEPITKQRANFPLSYPMTAKSFMEKHGILDREEYQKRRQESEARADEISYPLEPLVFERRANPLNVLLINVNNLRADALNQEAMPFTAQFADNALNFTRHYSSSNDVQGMFGLFYGLPTSYLGSVANQGADSILLSTLGNNDYQFGLFSDHSFNFDLYTNLIFRDLPVEEGLKGDRLIETWSQWVSENSGAPWFNFIELTTVEQFNAMEEHQGSTLDKLKQGYVQSVKQADKQLEQILAQLDVLEVRDETVVIITSNHGIEFNETKTNSWGAGSNYSDYQLSVPLVIKWPGKLAAEYTHSTSHLDVSVTLMEELLGTSSNPSDYSSGRNLFNERKRKWVIAGNNNELALLTPSKTTVVDRYGNYKVYNENYQRLKDESPTLPVLMQALTELQRFYND